MTYWVECGRLARPWLERLDRVVSGRSSSRARTAKWRRIRTFAKVVAAEGPDPITDLQGGEHIVGEVPTADSCTAANAGTPPAQIRAGGSPAHRSDPRAPSGSTLPQQRDEFERRKDGLRLSVAAVVKRTSFGSASVPWRRAHARCETRVDLLRRGRGFLLVHRK
jgi:hypothetical protein